jgi:hypothetical protein
MKLLHKINAFALGLNLLLIVVPVFAMLALIPLGILQFISAIIITLKYYKGLSLNHRKLIEVYWILVAIDFTGILMVWTTDMSGNSFLMLPIFVILPPAIAIYFVYITYTIAKETAQDIKCPYSTN